MAKSEEQVVEQDRAASSLGNSVDDNNNSDDSNSSVSSIDDGNKSRTMEASGGKYQLRPRSLHARRLCDGGDWSFQDAIRSKPRPPPLSRYRRKTANARERYRMRQINTAFESLRGVLPSWVCSRRTASDMTKIATLRLASAYIRSLQDILDGNAPQDTCSWVLSSILQDASRPHDDPESSVPKAPGSDDACAPSEADLVSLLCGSSGAQDGLESLSYLAPMAESDTVTLLLLESDSHRHWNDQQPPLVS
ncbi:twist-related protein-like [Penaeus japonicus]|uniref:twist-related protein-like n=1 Tax=Penaeus japonicus TaxID=27405 RepID=UPI001C71758B|nr:twist-related protein-like [Penaeus japonicus]